MMTPVRIMAVVMALAAVLTAVGVSAQGYIEPVDVLQLVLDEIAQDVESPPPPAVEWEAQDWTPMGLVGFGTTGFVYDSWRARVGAPVVPSPEYEVALTDISRPGIWVGRVSPEGEVSGEWVNVEENLIPALEAYLAEQGFDVEEGATWERVPLDFDTGEAARAGYFPSLVTAVYLSAELPVVAVVWYDVEPPYNVILQADPIGVAWLRFSDYEEPDLTLFGNTVETDELVRVEAVQTARLDDLEPDEAIALRIFADFSNSCALPGPFTLSEDGTEAMIGLIVQEGDDCFEQRRYFEMVIGAPGTLGSINGTPLDDLLLGGEAPMMGK